MTPQEREHGAAIAAGIGQYGAAQAPTAAPGTAIYQRQWTQGASRFCQYNRFGSPVIVTVRSHEMCPVNIP